MRIINLQDVRKKLAEPFPFTGRFSDSVKTFAIISGFVLLFVFLFRSDYLTQNGGIIERITISIWFGLATFCGASLNTLVLMFLLPTDKDQTWKVWHEIVLYISHFLVISIFNFLVASFILRYVESFSLGSLLSVMASTFFIGIMPVSIHVLQQQKKIYKANYDLAIELNQGLRKEKLDDKQNRLTLKNEEVIIEEVIFVESKKNYISLTSSDCEMATIRMTLKEMEQQLAAYPQFVRCHRAFMVNLNKLVKVEGNAQGLKLHLKGSPILVPVSRSYIPKIDHLIRPA